MQPPQFLEQLQAMVVGALQPLSEAPLPRLSERAGHSSTPLARGSSNQKVAP